MLTSLTARPNRLTLTVYVLGSVFYYSDAGFTVSGPLKSILSNEVLQCKTNVSIHLMQGQNFEGCQPKLHDYFVLQKRNEI